MEPLLPAGIDTTRVEREPEDSDAKRKIQFSVPSAVPIQLDPRQVELVRIMRGSTRHLLYHIRVDRWT